MGNGRLTGQQVDEVISYFGVKVGVVRCKYREFLGKRIEREQTQDTAFSARRDVLHSFGIEKAFCCDAGRALGNQAFADKLLPGELGVNADRIGLQKMMLRVAQEYSVSYDDLCSLSRTKGLSEARALICHLTISQLKISGAEVAQYLSLARSSVTRAGKRGKGLVKANFGLVERFLKT